MITPPPTETNKTNDNVSLLSRAWFGIITYDNNMSAVYRKLLDFKKASYRIIGKLRNNDDDMIVIKFVLIFDDPVNFDEITNTRYNDVFNTIVAIDDNMIPYYIDLVQKITYIQSGMDPISKVYVEDERYYSSEDSAYTDSQEEDEEEDEDDDDDVVIKEEEEKQVAERDCVPCVTFFWMVAIGLFIANHIPHSYAERIDKWVSQVFNNLNNQ